MGYTIIINRKFFFTVLLLFIGIIVSGCGAQATVTSSPTSTAASSATINPPGPTVIATPVGNRSTALPPTGMAVGVINATMSPSPSYDTLKHANSCNLINSQDLAHLFPPHNEIVRDQPKTSQIDHPPFSDAQATGTETACTFYDFHQPGGNTGWMLQITYLVDIPDPSTTTAWSSAWSAAKGKSSQPLSGMGDGAFINGTNLYIKLGDHYLTFEAADTHLDAKTASGAQQLVSYEKQLATNALDQLK